MSIFKTVELPCPTCATRVSLELVHSVNADRRPDLRQAVLDGTFQREQCPACGLAFRVEPEFTYIDVGRGQFVTVGGMRNADSIPVGAGFELRLGSVRGDALNFCWIEAPAAEALWCAPC